MRYLLIVFVLVGVVGCNKQKPAPKEPQKLPILEQSQELTTLPEYQGPTEGGKAVGVGEGEAVPFNGILLTEDKAMAAAALRISYDELYRLAEANRKYLLTVIAIQEQGIQKADRTIEKKDKQIDKLQNSWWQRNKLSVGIGTGIVIGVAISLATGVVWAKIERDENGT